MMSPHAWCLIVLTMVAVVGASESDGGDSFPLYVGAPVCRECHGSIASRAEPAAIPRKTFCCVAVNATHERAFEALRKPEAASIAAISGVFEPPTQSRICTDCHATGADDGPRWWSEGFNFEGGVQCEACHGPGSVHVAAARREKSVADERFADGASVAASIRRGDRGVCVTCHIEKPSHVEVLKNGYRTSPIDARYKTPVAIAVAPGGDRLYVVCERSNSVLEVDVEGRGVLRETSVGIRPQAIALDESGRRAYVSNRLGGSISVIDLATFQEVRQIPAGHEPHALFALPGGKEILVLATGQDQGLVVDSSAATVSSAILLGPGPWDGDVDAAGQRLYVTNVRPLPSWFREPARSELTVIDLRRRIVHQRLTVPEANMLQGIAWLPRHRVAVFTLARSKNLIPTSRLQQGWVITHGLGVAWPDGRVDQVLLDEPGASFPDLTDIAATLDGRRIVVISGGGNQVAILDAERLLEWILRHTDEQRDAVLPNFLGSAAEFVLTRINVGANPRGIALSPDQTRAFVANALDDTVSVIDISGQRVTATLPLGGPEEVTALRRGERLFHDASNSFGKQFSCRSCHPDGHVNGLTFDIEADGAGVHPVDNRTLRGIYDTPPFKWEGTNPTVHRQCGPRLAVFFTRLDPFTPEQLDSVVQYMRTIEQPLNRHRRPEGLTLAQRRGKAVFDRTVGNHGDPIPPELQCRTCHGGAYLTDRRKMSVATTMWFDVYGESVIPDVFNTDSYGELGVYYLFSVDVEQREFDVPHLRNIADSAPYLHNGAAATLEEVWTRYNMINRHGATSNLTRQQLNDLIAYLKSL